MNNQNKKNKKKKGFTLIELIIVLAVMAIIGAIAIPSLTGVKENTKISADRQSAETIKRTVLALVVEDSTISGDYSTTSSDGKTVNAVNPANDKMTNALKGIKNPQSAGASFYKINIVNEVVTVTVVDSKGDATTANISVK